MSSFPFVSLFTSSLILGTIIALSGTHWVFVWLGLELNLISFIPLITFSSRSPTAEAAINYFLAQALGSGFILLGSLSFYINPQILFNVNSINLLLLLGLLIKLGLPPCHFWMPSVISLLSWPLCILLISWQKLAPIIILFYLFSPNLNSVIVSLIILRSLLGGIGGLNQTQLRPLLAYSSIGHISWIIAARLVSFTAGIIYLSIYILINLVLIRFLWRSSSSNNSSLNSISSNNIFNITLLGLIFSLGGIPPFLGFFPKWLIIESIRTTSIFIVFILLLGSIINLYYYLNLAFIALIKAPRSPLVDYTNKTYVPLILPLRATITLGLGPILFLIIYALTIFY